MPLWEDSPAQCQGWGATGQRSKRLLVSEAAGQGCSVRGLSVQVTEVAGLSWAGEAQGGWHGSSQEQAVYLMSFDARHIVTDPVSPSRQFCW